MIEINRAALAEFSRARFSFAVFDMSFAIFAIIG